ncbi:MAG: hypothetical protein Q8Q58_02080 [Candidatus Rokubacteria bacterium]|nr:hypothetical protein [Candidatus Rokubacteria bacterium]
MGRAASHGLDVDEAHPAEFLAARRLYCEMAGWDPDTGQPTAAKLAELGVDEAMGKSPSR